MKEKRIEAIALKYDQKKDFAPRVTGKGKGKIAERILQTAEEHHVPIQEDPSLVELLGKLSINDTIPAELYEAVAEVFAFIYKADKEAGKRKGSRTQNK